MAAAAAGFSAINRGLVARDASRAGPAPAAGRGKGSGVVLCVGLGSGTLPAFWSWQNPSAAVQARLSGRLCPLRSAHLARRLATL